MDRNLLNLWFCRFHGDHKIHKINNNKKSIKNKMLVPIGSQQTRWQLSPHPSFPCWGLSTNYAEGWGHIKGSQQSTWQPPLVPPRLLHQSVPKGRAARAHPQSVCEICSLCCNQLVKIGKSNCDLSRPLPVVSADSPRSVSQSRLTTHCLFHGPQSVTACSRWSVSFTVLIIHISMIYLLFGW